MTREELLARKKLMDEGRTAEQAEQAFNTQATANVPTQAVEAPTNIVSPTQKVEEAVQTVSQVQEPVQTTPTPAVSPARQELLDRKAKLDAWNLPWAIWAQDTATVWQFQDLDKIKAESEQFKLEQEKIKAESERTRQEELKKQQDQFNQDVTSIYSKIQSWVPVDMQVQETPAYKQANLRANEFNKYNSMTTSQLSNAISEKSLLPWTDLYNDLLKTSPEKIREAESMSTISNMLSKEKKTTEDYQEIISKYILQNFIWDTDSLQWAISANPEVNRLNTTLTESKTELDTLKDQIDNAEDDILEELKWTWATTAYKNALVADRLKDLYRAYSVKSSEYNNIAWQLQQTTENIKTEYEQTEANQKNALEALQTLYWMSLQEREYEDQQSQILRDYQFDQQELQAKYWEPTTWAWSTVWTLDFSQDQDLITKYIWEASFKNNNPTWITFWAMSNELKQMFDEAWINYWEWTARPAAEWWNYVKFATVDDWLNAYRIALTQRWDDIYSRLKAWVWTAEWDSYATNLMNQAWIEKWAKFSEISEDQLQELMAAQLQKESPNFYNEIMAREEAMAAQQVDFRQESVPQFINYLQSWKVWSNTAELEAIEQEFWSVENFKRQAEAYNNSENWPRQKELDEVNKLKDKIQWLISNETAIDDVTWAIKTAMPWDITNKYAFIWDLQNLVDWNTLQQLIDAKADWAAFWALSNEELRMLQRSANEISPLIEYDEDDKTKIIWIVWWKDNFKEKLNNLLIEYNNIISKKEAIMWKETQLWNIQDDPLWLF